MLKNNCTTWLIVAVTLFLLACVAMAEKRDYYDVMHITRDATQPQIKKVYRRLAAKLHPDKNKGDPDAEKKLQELNEANEVLSDPEKRKKYDQFGHAAFDNNRGGGGGFHHGGFPGGFGFENFFQGGGGGSWTFQTGGFGHQQQRQQQHQGPKLYESSAFVELLDGQSLKEAKASNQIWLVKFFSNSCSHCHKMSKDFESAAENLNSVAKFGAVDCAAQRGTCNPEGINGFPTLILFVNGKRITYEGDRSAASMVRFVTSNIPTEYVERVGQENSQDFLSAHPAKVKVVLFSTKTKIPNMYHSLASLHQIILWPSNPSSKASQVS